MLRRVTSLASVLIALAAVTQSADSPMESRANELAHRFIITDGHIDVPYRLNEKWADVSQRTKDGDFDYVRAKNGGLDAPFMSIYTPADAERQGRSKAIADSLIDMVEKIAREHPDKFALASSPDQVEAQFKNGIISFCMGMENGSPIEGDLKNVEYFYRRGVRYITLTHSKDNHICDSSYDTTGTWQGLSEFGREVVREMNRVGIMIDVSHISDKTFWQVIEMTRAPVIASHSSCRSFVPGFERNMNDDMIRRLAENGGVIQVNFGSTFISAKSNDWWTRFAKARDAYLDENGFSHGSEQEEAYYKKYLVKDPFPYADVADVADHIDHIVKIAGIDHAGFGSDFDGVGDSLPTHLKDVSHYPNLIAELLERGYSDEDIEKICYKNVFRVWRAVERVAGES